MLKHPSRTVPRALFHCCSNTGKAGPLRHPKSKRRNDARSLVLCPSLRSFSTPGRAVGVPPSHPPCRHEQGGSGWAAGCSPCPDQATSPCHQERATASGPAQLKGSLRSPPPRLLWPRVSLSCSPPSHPFLPPRLGSGSISALPAWKSRRHLARACSPRARSTTRSAWLRSGASFPKLERPPSHTPPPPGPAGPSWPCLGARGHRGPRRVPRHLWESGVVTLAAWRDAVVAGRGGGDTHPGRDCG